jgi:hypothetical protein
MSVEMIDVFGQHLFEVTSVHDVNGIRSRHSRRTLPIQRSAIAFDSLSAERRVCRGSVVRRRQHP